jgi:small redox-active disulfide protein 2
MNIKILGTGCAKCKALEKATKEIINEAGLDANITVVEDIMEIMQYGVMTTPALVIDEKVVIRGKVPKTSVLKELLTN